MLIAVVLVILVMGIYPQPFLRRMDLTVVQIVHRVEHGPPHFALRQPAAPLEPTR